MKKTNKIMVLGSSNTDMVIYTDHFPQPGETILGGHFLLNPGGKGANQAVAAARLDGSVIFAGKTGNDVFGKEAIHNLQKEGIDVSLIASDSGHSSGIAQIIVDKKGENCITVAPGANMALMKEDVDSFFTRLDEVEILLMQLEIPVPSVIYAAEKSSRQQKKVILNPAPATVLPDELYPLLYMITPNETEAGILTGTKITDERTAAKAARQLREKGVKIAVITLGDKGAYVSAPTMEQLIPAPKVKAADTTAAGDTFNGALAVALTQGFALNEAVLFAVQAASVSVTRKGAQASVPTLDELDAFYNNKNNH